MSKDRPGKFPADSIKTLGNKLNDLINQALFSNTMNTKHVLPKQMRNGVVCTNVWTENNLENLILQ